MITHKPPEAADGGFWCTVHAVIGESGGLMPATMPNVGWCAWYRDGYALVRTSEPVVCDVCADVTAEWILQGDPKPFGRTGDE